MRAIDLFETIEYGPEHTGPAVFPVDLFKSSDSFACSVYPNGHTGINNGQEVIQVHFCLERDSDEEDEFARRLINEAVRQGRWSGRLFYGVGKTVKFELASGDPYNMYFTYHPEKAGLFRVTQGSRSGLVVMDSCYVW